MLFVVALALNNAINPSSGFTPSFVNGFTHPRVPLTLPLRGSGLGVGEMADRIAGISPSTVHEHVSKVLATRLNVLRHVRDAVEANQDK